MAISLGKIIDIAVVLIIIAILLPVAIGQFNAVPTTNWDSTVASLWKNILTFAMVGIVIYILYGMVKGKAGGG